MCKFIKITTFLFLFSIVLLSCETKECVEEIISDEQTITSDLTDKIIATATSVNDYSLLDFDCLQQFDGDTIIFFGHFINHEGVGWTFSLPYHVDFWEARYQSISEAAFSATGVLFSEEDFYISSIDIGNGSLLTKEQFVDFFEDCSFDGDFTYDNDSIFLNLEISEVNFDCSGIAYFDFVDNFNSDFLADTQGAFELSQGITALENELNTYNTNNQTTYTLTDIRMSALVETSNSLYFTLGIGASRDRQIVNNYFDGCSYERAFENYDVLNFEYPLQVNRYSIDLDEVITYTAENNEDIIDIFSEDIGELTFVYPINLLAQNGDILSITSNEELETTLDNSLDYVNYNNIDNDIWTGGGF